MALLHMRRVPRPDHADRRRSEIEQIVACVSDTGVLVSFARPLMMVKCRSESKTPGGCEDPFLRSLAVGSRCGMALKQERKLIVPRPPLLKNGKQTAVGGSRQADGGRKRRTGNETMAMTMTDHGTAASWPSVASGRR